MEIWLLIVETNCKEKGRDEEFNRWYDQTHIPDILRDSPGIKAAKRYSLIGKGEETGRYIVVYDIETDDIKQTLEAHARNMEEKKAAGRWTDLLEVVSRRVCKIEKVEVAGYKIDVVR